MQRTHQLLLVTLALSLACGGGTTENPPPPPPTVPVATVTVTPSSDTVVIRAALQLTAVTRDSVGTTLTGRTVTWSVTDATLASVTQGELVTPLLPGVVRVIATSETKSDTATLALVPVLSFSPRLPSLFVGDTVHLTAALHDALGGVVPGTVTWASRQSGKATVNAGVTTALDTGLVTVVASGTAIAESVVVAVLQPRVGVNREIAYLTDSARSDGWQIPTLRTYLPGDPGSKRVSAFDEYVNEYAWSPDGARLAFSYLNFNLIGRGSVWVANADGSGEAQVGPPGSHPSWSPDGSRIAYRGSTNPAKIIVAEANGGGSQTITSGGSDDLDPEWSPDGRQIAFRRQTSFCDQMWVMDANGGNARQITVPVLPCQFHWSPDGKLIVIEGWEKPYNADGGLWVIQPDGAGFRALSPNCDATGACTGSAGGFAEWSPDGATVIYSDGGGGVHACVRATGVVTSFQVPQFCCMNVAGPVHWSPDGQKLLYPGPYVDPQLGNVLPLIGVMNVDGSNQVPIINFHAAQGSGTWRP
jgi:hypothetical protein